MPAIVSIVLARLTKLRAVGQLTETVLTAQIQRLAREELEPRCLTMLVRDLPNGHTRFSCKEAVSGTVCAMMEFERDGSATVQERPGLRDCGRRA